MASDIPKIPISQSVVVLGGAGFLGSHLVEKLIEAQFDSITVVDNLSDALYENNQRKAWVKSLPQSETLNLIETDFDSDVVFEVCRKSDIVINLAAIAGLRKSWEIPTEIFNTNFLAFHRLVNHLEASNNPPYLIHASTSSVYGKFAVGNENLTRNPVSPYGASKLAAELRLESLNSDSRLSWTILRLFSLYGPRQRSDMAYHRAIVAATTGGEFVVFGDGSQQRTNTFVTDAADAIFRTLTVQPHRRIINVADNQLVSLNEALQIIESLTEKSIKRTYRDPFPGDQSVTQGDNRLAKQILNWEPSTPLEMGLQMQIDSL